MGFSSLFFASSSRKIGLLVADRLNQTSKNFEDLLEDAGPGGNGVQHTRHEPA